MAKRKRKIKHHHPHHFVYSSLSVFAVVIALVSVAFYNVYTKNANTVCANAISCAKDLTGKYEENASGVFMGKKVSPPSYIAENFKNYNVLGSNTGKDKHIYIDLGAQTLYADENGKHLYVFPVSTGKWYPTPTGDFKIWVKLRYTRMTGGNASIGTFYDLPNVPFVMFFYGDEVSKGRGFSIHGAYWHDNFGHIMSHGCVNMRITDAEKIYNWANPTTIGSITYATDSDPGTPITIYGTPPEE